MKGLFRTKKDTVSYYDKHNSHMRSLNAHNTYKSDWDPESERLYVVRKYVQGVVMNIEPFDPEDRPTRTEEGVWEYEYLK